MPKQIDICGIHQAMIGTVDFGSEGRAHHIIDSVSRSLILPSVNVH